MAGSVAWTMAPVCVNCSGMRRWVLLKLCVTLPSATSETCDNAFVLAISMPVALP